MPAAPSVRVVVRLPWNRPDDPPDDPPQIEWTPEKADILWKVIERSRSSDGSGADWKGLAAHLDVPLPYLLYRVNARFQEEIRGLRDIQGVLNPQNNNGSNNTISPVQASPQPGEDSQSPDKPLAFPRYHFPDGSAHNRPLDGSGRLPTRLSVRARLSSLNSNHSNPASPLRPKKATSSSTITLQVHKRHSHQHHTHLRPMSASPTPSASSSSSGRRGGSESDDEDDEEEEEELMLKEEEAERHAEEQEALDRKLERLHQMMTSDALGLMGSSRPSTRPRPRDGMMVKAGSDKDPRQRQRAASASTTTDRGRFGPGHGLAQGDASGGFNQQQRSALNPEDHQQNRQHVRHGLSSSTTRSASASTSQSVSSASSPQGSIPDIPSPPAQESQSSPSLRRHLSPPGKSSSPPTVSARSAVGQSHRRYGPLVDRGFGVVGTHAHAQGSGHGSETSSFSDLSGMSDASLSPSALESALLSNIRGANSRFSHHSRSRMS